MKRDVLHVGNDDAVALELAGALSASEIGVHHARTPSEAERLLAKGDFDAVFVDGALDEAPRTELFALLRERFPDVPPIVIAAGSEDDAATESLRVGAFEVLYRPLPAKLVQQALKRALLATDNERREPPRAPITSAVLPLESESMQEVQRLVARAAKGNATVMIRGESGTGKEVIARTIHQQSPRANGPFIKVHCAALPEPILESELFGYEKGAFTGAATRKPGRVELAEGGTLFLDEIGDVSPAVQVKLLRVIQDREYERLGGVRTLKADVRFICATHRHLEQMVKANTFREDLYYRLNVVRIFLPPLRGRREDIERLAEFFCRSACQQNKKQVVLEPSAIEVIGSASWPGNVRQLQNFIERLVVLSDTPSIDGEQVRRELASDAALYSAEELTKEPSTVLLEAAVRKAERRALERALRKTDGNRSLAARILGVSRRTLFYKLREHGLS
jgi:two-component system response regulator AtoC